MTQTANLLLPYIIASQAQKHIMHNEALRKLDVLAQLVVKTRILSSPPITLEDGDVYIVSAAPTNEWSSHENELAAFQDGVWEFYQPREGVIAWIEDEKLAVVLKDGVWSLLIETLLTSFDMLGINATADTTNRLSVTSPASLFNHEGAGHQLKLNKNAAVDTASLLLQTGFSGRVEMGLAGDDDFHVKTSSDGNNWKEAIIIDAESAEVSFPETSSLANPALFNLLGDGGRFAGSPEPKSVIAPSFVNPSYFLPYNGSVFVQGPKFIHNNNNFGGTAGVMTQEAEQLVQKMRPGASANVLRYGPEFYTLDVTAGNGTALAITVDGTSYYKNLVSRSLPIPHKVTLNYWLYVFSGSCALRPDSKNYVFVDGVPKASNTVFDNNDGWMQVSIKISYDANNFVGYSTNLSRVYQTPGSKILIAAPILFPGHLSISPAHIYGVVGSFNVWE